MSWPPTRTLSCPHQAAGVLHKGQSHHFRPRGISSPWTLLKLFGSIWAWGNQTDTHKAQLGSCAQGIPRLEDRMLLHWTGNWATVVSVSPVQSSAGRWLELLGLSVQTTAGISLCTFFFCQYNIHLICDLKHICHSFPPVSFSMQRNVFSKKEW